MRIKKPNKLPLALTVVSIVILAGLFALSVWAEPFEYQAGNATSTGNTQALVVPQVKHLATPTAVKAIYMSQCVSGTPSMRDNLVNLIDATELNAVIIDVKDYTGKIAFQTDNPILKDSVSDACGARDMKEFVEKLHDKNIYVIARVTVFQDPFYTKLHPETAVKKLSNKETVWRDRKGLAFVDVGAKPYWDYIIALAKESYNLGFDEINFDYVRFPSDGNMEDIYFSWSVAKGQSKPEALENFFKYLHDNLKSTGMMMSADLFGMTTTNTDDLNIGQVLERTVPYFDYVAPMVYPSHYPPNFNGWKNPNNNVYDLIKYVMQTGVNRLAASTTTVQAFNHQQIGTSTPAVYKKPVYNIQKLRPWLQDFDYGGNYGATEVRAQIQATYDVGLNSWMIWDPSNKYTRDAYKTE